MLLSIALRAAAALLLAQALPAVAQTLTISPAPLSPRTDEPVYLRLSGVWPTRCPPVMDRLQVSGRDVEITLRQSAEHCIDQPQAFHLLAREPDRELPSFAEGGVYRIRVFAADGRHATRQIGFRLLEVGLGGRRAFPETGFWWNEAGGELEGGGPGFGLQLEQQDSTLAVSVLGYDSTGSAEWYLGAAPLVGRSVRVPLTRLAGGSGPFGTWRAPGAGTEIGAVHLEFIDDARLNAWFEHEHDGEVRVHAVSMVRFSFAESPTHAWQGSWLFSLQGARSGEPRLLQLDLRLSVESAHEVVLHDAQRGFALRCAQPAESPGSPPRSCRLLSADGEEVLAEFDSAGLQRLRGRSASGGAAYGFRLSR